MGVVVLEFIHDSIIQVSNLMKNTIIFDSYLPFFNFSVSLWDFFVGILSTNLIALIIFGADNDD